MASCFASNLNNTFDDEFYNAVRCDLFPDYGTNSVEFISSLRENNVTPNFIYGFSYDKSNLNLWVEKGVENCNKSLLWIISKVIPKLLKWMQHAGEDTPLIVRSLGLVGITEYSTLYNRLKETYGKQLVQVCGYK